MTDNQLLSAIRYNPRLHRQFHNLTLDERRRVLTEANGSGEEKLLLKLIRRAKRARRQSTEN